MKIPNYVLILLLLIWLFVVAIPTIIMQIDALMILQTQQVPISQIEALNELIFLATISLIQTIITTMFLGTMAIKVSLD